MDDLSSLENLEFKRQLSFLESPRGSDWPKVLIPSNTGKATRNRRKSAVSGDRSLQKNYQYIIAILSMENLIPGQSTLRCDGRPPREETSL